MNTPPSCIIIAPDKFKGTYKASEISLLIKASVEKTFPSARILLFPLADGGEGSVEALSSHYAGRFISAPVHDPLMRPLIIPLWIQNVDAGERAVLEMAASTGLGLVPPEHRNPLFTSSFGFGEQIVTALESGIRDFLLCIGGSATNDAGAGMLQALGYHFYDKSGLLFADGICGGQLSRIERCDASERHPLLDSAHFRVACDVGNPLLGPNGASSVFGPQKGASENDVRTLELAIESFAKVCSSIGLEASDFPGAGAAGGMGWALQKFLGAELLPGASLIADAVGLEKALATADLLISGEGRLDQSSLNGKLPIVLVRMAQKAGVPALLICGQNTLTPGQMKENNLPPCILLKDFRSTAQWWENPE